MALAATDRGSNNNNTAGTTFTITPATDFTPASLAVLCLALDNSGASGAATTVSVSTGVGAWTASQSGLYDPGAASAGVQIALLTCNISSWAAGTNLTVTLGNSTTAKAWTLTEVRSDVEWGYASATKIAGGVNTGAASAAPTVTTGSITSGDIVFGWGGAESANTWAGDADTLNGSWSTQQSNAAGTGTTGMSVTSQWKIVNATAAQTYNPTLTSADVIIGWAQFRETVTAMPWVAMDR